MGRTGKSGFATPAAQGKAANSSSVVQNLKMLREFCPGWRETDLSTCLRQCGYNVERAAERLLNGQYQPAKQHSASKTTPKTVPLSSINPATSTNSSTAATCTPASTSSSSIKKRPSASTAGVTDVSDSTTTIHPTKKPHIVPPTPCHDNSVSPTSTTTPSSTSALLAKIIATFRRPKTPIPHDSLLLCQRWLVGTCTSRNGRFVYQEPLDILHYKTETKPNRYNTPPVRFQGREVEGQLARSLSVILTPLLRYPRPVVTLQAEALMEDRDIPIGGEVPIQLKVYISPEFFDLFDNVVETPNKATMYFQNHKHKGSGRRGGPMTIGEAAFALLQWAEYGNLPEIPDFTPDKPIISSTSSSEGKPEAEEDESSNDADDVEEDEDDAILAEEDFTAEGTSDTKVKTPEWARSVTDVADEKATLPEMDDPVGFKDAVVLRPYQRQALHFMMSRERNGEGREELQQQLELLAELASNNQNSSPRTQNSTSSTSPIHCDCGPVLVSEAEKRNAKTLDGQVDPVKHPLWQQRFLATQSMDAAFSFYVNELLGIASAIPPPPPKQVSGGILADAMGLGKTVELLALIMKSKEKHGYQGPTLVVAPLSLIAQWEEELEMKSTLSYRIHYETKDKTTEEDSKVDVVVTTYGTMQAELQALKKTKGGPAKGTRGLLGHPWLRVILDEGQAIKNANTLASKACCLLNARYRWLVTGTLISNSLDEVGCILKFLKHEPWNSPSFWKAAITDEMRRDEKADSHGNGGDKGCEKKDTGMMLALSRVRRLLAPIMIRRTKESLSGDGKPILTLPPVETKTIAVTLSDAEREFYNALLERSQHMFYGYIKAGTASRSWFAIFSLLHRLRQACVHISLTIKKYDEDWNASVVANVPDAAGVASAEHSTSAQGEPIDDHFLEGLLKKFHKRFREVSRDKNDQSYSEKVALLLSEAVKNETSHLADECAFCMDTPRTLDAAVTQCAHVFCQACLVDYLQMESEKPCPMCSVPVQAKDVIALSKTKDGKITTTFLPMLKKAATSVPSNPFEKGTTAAARKALERAVNGAGSSKLTAVMKELHAIWEQDPNSKVLIFSQFLGFLDLLGKNFEAEGIPFGRIDGTMSLKERVATIDTFKTDSHMKPDDWEPSNTKDRIGSVLLLSMKLGVGLNLVAASTVFVVDPWWNASVEEQCINRIHRIGQKAKVVRVRKFVVNESVEERMVELQKKKKDMASEVLCDVGEDRKASNSRLSLDDFKLIFSSLQ